MENKKTMNLRERILTCDDLKNEIILVDEWGEKVEIKSLTGKARAELIDEVMKKNGKMDIEKLYPQLIIMCSFDPLTHKQIFSSTDRDLINGKNSGALEKIAKVAMKLSGLNPDDVEEAEKN